MKKIYAVIMSAAILVSSVSAFAADGEQATMAVSSLKSNSQVENKVTGTFIEGASGVIKEMSVNGVMTALKNLTATKDVVQKIQIRSTAVPVDCWLKLELPAESGYARSGGYSAVDYYSLKITDKNEKVIYDDASDNAQSKAGEKKIHLGTIDEDNKSKTAEYNIYVSVNDAVNTSELSDKPSDVQWKLIYTNDTKNFEPTPSPVPPSVTAAPSANVTPAPAVNVSPGATATVNPSVSPSATAGSKLISIAVTSKEVEGDSVKPGTYKLIGKGNAVVTDEKGEKLSEIKLAEELAKAASVTIKEGDKVTLTGNQDAYIQFKSAVVATATPKATAKVTAKATSTAKATVKPTATAKANPKTGDTAPIVGVSVTAVIALAAALYILLTSKRKNK